MSDFFNLQRFKVAQDVVYHKVVTELDQGRKNSHWMWYIFPQIQGLGSSSTARKFAITCREEAVAYLSDPLLKGRLIECCRLLLAVKEKSARDILGYPDDLKLCSSMTLFAQVAKQNENTRQTEAIFQQVLNRFYHGKPDPITLNKLRA
ncbi:DUF1810 domain-containing protein [Aliikangiella sp. G2MR2-5]|uniref:DUF1810 domain-containing protein n=1 Tax=Aliikangiella sp. G2MR2-5 TaxID=2788943 RepID=UPI0018AC87CD|nr:DUF1810 domain-containing protein [Aliikangiella sp. G2MR2-5]